MPQRLRNPLASGCQVELPATTGTALHISAHYELLKGRRTISTQIEIKDIWLKKYPSTSCRLECSVLG